MIQLKQEVEVPTEVIRSGDVAGLKKVLGHLEHSVSTKQTKLLLERVAEAADSVGNVTHAGGKPLTAELLLESFRTMELVFDDAGNWDMPTMVFHPTMAQAAQRELGRLFTDPDLKQQVD